MRSILLVAVLACVATFAFSFPSFSAPMTAEELEEQKRVFNFLYQHPKSHFSVVGSKKRDIGAQLPVGSRNCFFAPIQCLFLEHQLGTYDDQSTEAPSSSAL